MQYSLFKQLVADGFNKIPVYRSRIADTETPLSVFSRLQHEPLCYLFESVEGGERWARFSIIGLGRGEVLSCQNSILNHQQLDGEIIKTDCNDPFDYIRQYLQQYRVPEQKHVPELPQFTGGLVGYFGYDAVRYIEPKLNQPPLHDPMQLEDIWLMLSETVLVFDNLKNTLFLIHHVDIADHSSESELDAKYQLAQTQLDRLDQLLDQPADLKAKPHSKPQFKSLTGKEKYMASVEKVKEYIRAGDVMQVVPGHRMVSDFDGDPISVYRALRYLNPSPYLFLVKGYRLHNKQPFHIVGSSPEILTRFEDGIATVRPLAGTRPRGDSAEQDDAYEKDLLADEKEIAEHVMLIDLGRNDIGRVSDHGTVEVTEQMVVERYSHVMHIVSNVQGKVQSKYDALDVLKATFPAGTLSGAPKVRAMEIIDELEPVRRGVFGGAVGYLGWHNDMDMAIAIRTAIITDDKVYLQAGAGLVADSVAETEWNETQIKAKAVMKAVELSANGLKFS